MGHGELEDRVAASVALIRKAERLALEYDPVNGFALAECGLVRVHATLNGELYETVRLEI